MVGGMGQKRPKTAQNGRKWAKKHDFLHFYALCATAGRLKRFQGTPGDPRRTFRWVLVHTVCGKCVKVRKSAKNRVFSRFWQFLAVFGRF